MLPLAGDIFPTTTEELMAALQRGFEAAGVTPRAIKAESGIYPQISALSIDLTNAQLTRDDRLHSVTGPSAGALTFERFEMFGAPLFFEKTPVEAQLEGQGVQFLITGEPSLGSLVLQSAASGTVSVKAGIEDLEGLLQRAAAEAASKQGVEVKKTKLQLTQEGPRAITFRATVTAKVFIMSAELTLTGRLDIDDAFNARLSSLGLDGDAMVTNLAGSFLRPRLRQLEGRTIPLFAFLPAGLKLHDIEVTVAPALHVQARFGSV